jgi:hypothetical protein
VVRNAALDRVGDDVAELDLSGLMEIAAVIPVLAKKAKLTLAAPLSSP